MPKVIALLILLPLPAAAQEIPVQEGASGRGLLAIGQVDYWRSGKPAAIKGGKPTRNVATVWAEPIRMPDGRYATYVPPPQVLQFLDDPTPERARQYLEWQGERVAKLRRAMEMLEAASEQDRKSEPPRNDIDRSNGPLPSPSKSKESPSTAGRFELLYFKQPGCSYCGLQDQVLADLRAKRPDLSIREILKEESPDLWKRYGIAATPTIVIRSGNSNRATLRGLAFEEQILSALHGESNREK